MKLLLSLPASSASLLFIDTTQTPLRFQKFQISYKRQGKNEESDWICEVLSSRIIHHVSRTLSRHYVCCMDVQLHPDLKACGTVRDLIGQRYWQRWMMPQNSHAQGWDGQQREGGCHCVCVPPPTHEHFWTLIQVNTILLVKFRAKAQEGRPDADQVQGGHLFSSWILCPGLRNRITPPDL